MLTELFLLPGLILPFYSRPGSAGRFIAAIPVSIGLCAVLGVIIETSVYRPLRHKGSSSLILLLASLGIYIVLKNIISMVFGDNTKTIRSGIVKEGLQILGARITPVQITIICVSLLLVLSCFLFLKYTKNGRSMRAVSNNPELALISGINSDGVVFWAFALGSALAGIAGILVALDVNMTPTMGMNALMMGVAAVIIGGVESIYPGWLWGAASGQGPAPGSMENQFSVAGRHRVCHPACFFAFQTPGFFGKEGKEGNDMSRGKKLTADSRGLTQTI